MSRRETAAKDGSASERRCTHPLQEAAGHQPAGARDGPAGVKQRAISLQGPGMALQAWNSLALQA